MAGRTRSRSRASNRGGLEEGQGKGGLEKGQGKGGLEKGQGKEGLEKGKGQGGLEKGLHQKWIQEEIDAGFDRGMQESRGRSSRWARQERRRADPAVQDRRDLFESGQGLEKKPPEVPKPGSQRHRAWLQLEEDVLQAERSLAQQKEAWAVAKEDREEKRKEMERLQQKEAWKKASIRKT